MRGSYGGITITFHRRSVSPKCSRAWQRWVKGAVSRKGFLVHYLLFTPTLLPPVLAQDWGEFFDKVVHVLEFAIDGGEADERDLIDSAE